MGRGGWRFGAGRPGWRVKAEQCLRLDVRDFSRRSLLATGHFNWHWHRTDTNEEVASISIYADGWHLRLSYRINDEPREQVVQLDRTPCHFGGTREWFRCPRCHRRVALLFVRGGGFACRSCHRVAYTSQSEDLCARLWRRQMRWESRLGPDWVRPKGMHRTTFERILNAIFRCEDRRDTEVAGLLARAGFADWNCGASTR